MVQSPSRDEAMKELEVLLSRIIAGKVSVSEQTSINHDLHIGGDDAADLIEGVHAKFGTRFDGFKYETFFPNETEVFGEHVARLFGFKNKKRKQLSVGHLVDVIQKGAWIDPPSPSSTS